MNEQVYNELYQIYCKALTKKSLAEVQEHFKNSGVEFELEIYNSSSDPMFNFTTVILRKADTTLRIDTTDFNHIKGILTDE